MHDPKPTPDPCPRRCLFTIHVYAELMVVCLRYISANAKLGSELAGSNKLIKGEENVKRIFLVDSSYN